MAIITNNGESIITNLEDALWYIENNDLIETKQQLKDIERIFNNNLYRVSNVKYYESKLSKFRYSVWEKKIILKK